VDNEILLTVERYADGIKSCAQVMLIRTYWIRNGIGASDDAERVILDNLRMIRTQADEAIKALEGK
jgi:hypothetical protein